MNLCTFLELTFLFVFLWQMHVKEWIKRRYRQPLASQLHICSQASVACDLGQQKKTTLKGRPNSPICVYYDVYPSDDLIVYNIYHSPVCVVNKDPISISAEGNFRSQTSDSMQGWKSRGGKNQRGEVKKWEDKRWRKSEERRCTCAKGRKVAIHCVFSNDLWLRRVEK